MKHSTPPITIWIHGTKPQQLLPGRLAKIHIESLYKFMHCEPGLHLAKDLNPSFHHFDLAQILHKTDPKNFPLETLYLFGWSGTLNAQDRLQAAQKLQKALKVLVSEYEGIHHAKPFIRIIAHSHGGNVALNLAKIDTNKQLHHAIVDELILLACPVQKVTAPLIKSPLFAKVYSLHSHWDFLQIADPQGWPQLKEHLRNFFKSQSLNDLKAGFVHVEQEPFFSERHFRPHSNLVQAVITINGNHVLHIQFMLDSFVKNIPFILEKLSSLETQKIQAEQEMFIDIPLEAIK